MAKKDPTIPVYLITGFLDGGKTNFLKYTLQEPYFNDGSHSLLILTEEGEEEFDAKILKKTRSSLVIVNDETELTTDYLKSVQNLYAPERVLIEYNGMWDLQKILTLELPKFWMIYQIITILDGANFGLYLDNIKAQSMAFLMNTDMVIFNRCRKDTDLVRYQRTVRSVNPRCTLVFEDDRGNEVECPEPDLPYSLETVPIEITDEVWGSFFLDLQEHPDRYVNKSIRFLLQIMQDKKFPKNMFVAGRRAMTCCEADIRFLPYIFIYEKASSLPNGGWATITASMKWQFHEGYREEGPVFYVTDLKLANPPAKELITF
ncbi:MAG: GTPase [Lachnospiraceae bacterium]|nr:GTPase [Lachnospiraceae bacterium]